MKMEKNSSPWSVSEVHTFVGILGEEEIQKALDGTVRNERVFRTVSERMAAEGFSRTVDQCRAKAKKLRCEYRKIKALQSRSGVHSKKWKWFDTMDSIYGHRSSHREVTVHSAGPVLDSGEAAPALRPPGGDDTEGDSLSSTASVTTPMGLTSQKPASSPEPFLRRRNPARRRREEVCDLVRDMMERDTEQFNILLEEFRDARREEREARREERESRREELEALREERETRREERETRREELTIQRMILETQQAILAKLS